MKTISYPRISIVTPSYNQAAYLEQTLKSVLDQDYPNLEYIVMDGGSTDGSIEIIERYSNKLTYWESGKDKGQADAIYRGFERATGEILGWVNSDDLLLPKSLEKVGRYFNLYPTEEWVTGGCIIIDNAGRYLRNRIGNPKCNLGDRVTFNHLLFFGCAFNQPASFWRKKSFFAAGGFDRSLQFCFDYDMYFLLARQCPSGNIRDYLACFRVHPASKGSTIRDIWRAENESLWHKYGRYEKPAWYRCCVAQLYAKRNFIKSCVLQLRLKTGSLKYSI